MQIYEKQVEQGLWLNLLYLLNQMGSYLEMNSTQVGDWVRISGLDSETSYRVVELDPIEKLIAIDDGGGEEDPLWIPVISVQYPLNLEQWSLHQRTQFDLMVGASMGELLGTAAFDLHCPIIVRKGVIPEFWFEGSVLGIGSPHRSSYRLDGVIVQFFNRITHEHRSYELGVHELGYPLNQKAWNSLQSDVFKGFLSFIYANGFQFLPDLRIQVNANRYNQTDRKIEY